LIVRRRTVPPSGRRLALDAVEVAIEGKVEVEPRLLPVRDHVESRVDLVVDGADDGVIDELCDVIWPEVVEVGARVLEPSREWITADHRRAERTLLHAAILAR
jgi:hypothetical protein